MKPMKVWLSSHEAAELVGRSELRLRDLRIKGLLRARKHRDTWEYERENLLRVFEQMRHNYTHRHIVPGTGRGRRLSPDQLPIWEQGQ